MLLMIPHPNKASGHTGMPRWLTATLLGAAVWLLTGIVFVFYSLATGVWLPIALLFACGLSLVSAISYVVAVAVGRPVLAVTAVHVAGVAIVVLLATVATAPTVPAQLRATNQGVVDLTPSPETAPASLILLKYVGLGSIPNALVALGTALLARRFALGQPRRAAGKLPAGG